MAGGTSRFAPSTTGQAHPGTLLSALLVWLDARARGDRALLRLENLDHTRSRAELERELVADLAWFGLAFDGVELQSDARARHEAALDRLAAAGRLYPCACSRKARQDGGRRAPDGGFAYDNRCRDHALPAGGWRAAGEPVRVRLPDRRVELTDDGGLDLSQTPAIELGDPIVVRRDGVLAYHLVVVVDDGAAGVTRIVRGRDLAAATATHVLLQELLGLPTPSYLHHLLLLERAGEKLAKLHGSIGARTLRAHLGAAELCGFLAHVAGLRPDAAAITPGELVADFTWPRVRRDDVVVAWDGTRLHAVAG